MFRFPFGTTQELNLDWFLEQWEIFKQEAQTALGGIDHALDAEIQRVEDAMTDLYAARDAAISAKNDALDYAQSANSSAIGASQSAQNSAASAVTSATQAQNSAASAVTSATQAQSAAQSAISAQSSATNAGTSAGNALSQAQQSEAWATGEIGGVHVPPSAPQNQSNSKQYATNAQLSANAANTAKNDARVYSQDSKAWATGIRNGEPVTSEDETYQNNAKYYAESISGDAAAAAQSASNAAASAASVGQSAAQIAQNASDIEDLKSSLEDTNELINTFASIEQGKNIFNPVNVKNGYYYGDGGGEFTNENYSCCEDYWEIEPNTNYSLQRYNPSTLQAKGAVYCFICFYDENKTYISWYENGGAYFTTPNNAKYMRFSSNTQYFNGTYLVQIEKGISYTSYEPYSESLAIKETDAMKDVVLDIVKTNGLNTVNITVDASGNGDYTSLRAAVDFITNSDYEASIIHIAPGTYDIASYYTEEELVAPGFVGLKLPVNCSLIGTGDREETILTWTFSERNRLISTLNLTSNNTLKNLRIEGIKTTYTVHDDFGYSFVNDKRLVENCHFVAEDNYYANAYGSGNTRNGATWTFQDCIFEANATPFSNHTGTGTATKNNILEFIDCQFINNSSVDNNGYAFMLRSLKNSMGTHYTLVRLYGCYGNGKIILGEENASVYGAGICFRVVGYADDFGEVIISHTDQADYSGYVDIR